MDIDALWKRYKKSNSKKSKLLLIEYYFPFVKKIAIRLADRLSWKVSPDELTSFGVDGLYKAIDRFDLLFNIKFESYANRRVRGSMIDGLRREDIIPRSVRIHSDRFNKHKQRLQNHLGYKISDVNFVDMVGMDEISFHKSYSKYTTMSFSSLDSYAETDSDDGIRNDCNLNFIDKSITESDSGFRRKEFFNKLMNKNFTSSERKIIYLYYYERMTMEKIAQVIGLSESRISQKHKEIIGRIRDNIKKNPDYFDKDILSFVINGIGTSKSFKILSD